MSRNKNKMCTEKKIISIFMGVVIDSWPNFPSGVFDGNYFATGSFPECFHIERNGTAYKTQYCIARLFADTSKTKFTWYAQAPYLSFGICLPATCRFPLVAIVNDVLRKNGKKMKVIIPRKICQSEETNTKWRASDFIVT